MNNEQIIDRLMQIISKILDIEKDEIHKADRLCEELRFDSVDFVHLQVEIEDTFDIRFDPSSMDIESIFKSITSLAEFIEKIEQN